MNPDGGMPSAGLSPDVMKMLQPLMSKDVLMGMGIPVLMGNIEKMHKLMTGGGAKAKQGQQPAGPQGAAPGPAAMPPAGASPSAGMDPAKMQLIMQIMQARGMA
jgi:hypothetical protein